jgi:hypothetical protein
MLPRILRRIGLVVGLAAFALPALGHHSFGMIDAERSVTLEGTIRRFDWSNPHVLIWVDVPQQGGEPVIWGIETTSPGNLQRAGWTKRSFNPGDEVSITISPLRNGAPGGAFRAAENRSTSETLEYDYLRLGQVQGREADEAAVPPE